MVDKLRDDTDRAAYVLKDMPPWVFLLSALIVPGGSAMFGVSMTREQIRAEIAEEIDPVKEDLKKEAADREKHEELCANYRSGLDTRLADFRVELNRQALMLQQVSASTDRLLAKVGGYQDDMTRLVRDIANKMPAISGSGHRGPAP